MSEPYRVLSLFAGIGGFDLGLERTGGFKTVAFCEIDPFCRRVLAKHWPEVPCYDDVRTLTAERLASDGIGVDVICGGFPCQDISIAGTGAGMDGSRSGLWGEFARLIGELRPRFVIVENVARLLTGPTGRPGAWFGRVLGDLAEIGYDAEWHCIPASYAGAPHIRDRIWVIAQPQHPDADSLGRNRAKIDQQIHAELCDQQDREPPQVRRAVADPPRMFRNGGGDHGGRGRKGSNPISKPRDCGGDATMADPNCVALVGTAIARQERDPWAVEPAVGRVVDGVPRELVEPRLQSLGNAVVPQIPEMIGRAILAADAERLAA